MWRVLPMAIPALLTASMTTGEGKNVIGKLISTF
jgi:hypothetical protein